MPMHFDIYLRSDRPTVDCRMVLAEDFQRARFHCLIYGETVYLATRRDLYRF